MLERYVALDVKNKYKEDANYSDYQVNEVLKDFNVTRAMKLLYFTCLASVNEKDNKVPNLFNTFDNFLAYPNGPVEEDVYSNCSLLFTFRKKAGEDYLETLQSRPEDMSQIEKLRFDEYKNNNSESINLRKAMIDDAVKKLSSTTEYAFPVHDTKDLIDLSHRLILWQEADAIYTEPLNLSTSKLIEEKNSFIQLIKNLNHIKR